MEQPTHVFRDGAPGKFKCWQNGDGVQMPVWLVGTCSMGPDGHLAHFIGVKIDDGEWIVTADGHRKILIIGSSDFERVFKEAKVKA